MTETIKVQCSSDTLYVPKRYMGEDMSLRFDCPRCGTDFTKFVNSVGEAEHVSCACNYFYAIEFVDEKKGLFRRLFGGEPDIEGMRGRHDVDGLIKALDHDKTNIVWDAAHALADLGDPKALQPLLALMGNRNAMRAKAASRALTALGSAAIAPLLKWGQDRTLASMGNVVVEHVLAAFNYCSEDTSEQKRVRETAVRVFRGLDGVRDPRAPAALLDFLRNEENRRISHIDARVLEALEHQRELAEETLMQSLTNEREDSWIRQFAWKVLHLHAFRELRPERKDLPNELNPRAKA